MFHGKGELTWNSETYKGQFFENHRVGAGTWEDCTGTYSGAWKSNTPTGRGVWAFSDKYQLEGVFHVGQPSGVGTITMKDSQNNQVPYVQLNDNRILLQSKGLLTPIQTSIGLLPMTSFLL